MLVTNPAARAPLTEVLSHPWMVRGFNGPPDAHLVHREPLRADDLDKQVIRGMQGFEFGSEEDIERRLIKILESDSYIRACRLWERKTHPGRNGHGPGRWGESFSNSSLAISFDGSSHKHDSQLLSPTLTKSKSKRFSGFDFYRRKLFSPSSSPPNSPLSNSPPNSASHLSNETPQDPTRGYHPLISMYYLAREKLERERVYGPGHFASSQLSLNSNAQGPTSVEDAAAPSYATLPKQVPSAKSKDGEQAAGQPKVDYSMRLPRLPAPETLHYSGMSYDAQTQQSASPTQAGFPQPRARDAGVHQTLPVPKRGDTGTKSVPASPAKQATMPRAPQATTHRRSHSMSQRPTVLTGLGSMFGGKDEEGPRSAAPATTEFEEKRRVETVDEKEQEGDAETNEADEVGVIAPPSQTSSSPTMSGGSTLIRRFGSLLVGKSDDSRGHGRMGKRATILGGFSPRPSADPEEKTVDEMVKEEDEKRTLRDKEETDSPTPTSSVKQSLSQPFSSAHRRAATIFDPHGRTARYERRSSTGAALLSGGTIGRRRRPSTASSGVRATAAADRFAKTDEEDAQDAGRGEEAVVNGVHDESGFREEDERHTSEKDFKPVFLKGLFRYVRIRIGSQ